MPIIMPVFVNYAHFSKNAEIMLLLLLTSSNLVKTAKYLSNRQMTSPKKVTAMHDQ